MTDSLYISAVVGGDLSDEFRILCELLRGDFYRRMGYEKEYHVKLKLAKRCDRHLLSNTTQQNPIMKLQSTLKAPEMPVTECDWFDLNENTPFEDALELKKCKLLAERVEDRLRESKSRLHCGEVLIPNNLTLRIAKDCLKMSESEPCGLRGCVIYINLEEKNACHRLGKVVCDTDTVSTFEITLNLRQDCNKWLNLTRLVPERLLKKFGKDRALVISESYTLRKKKLYRSNSS
ncbi:DNA damage-inducible transcript 4-like protein [Centruroides vittatus]|uniref:DNA damage-inducible transcript 4-like protein n=1 Tax=Centruroides vittatus TaxID=120091 RepID=UPI00350FD1C7